MIEKIKKFIKKHNSLYILARTIQNLKNSEFQKLIKGFFMNDNDIISFTVNNASKTVEHDIVYNIVFNIHDRMGFCATLRYTILNVAFAKQFDMLPNVVWGKFSSYYEPEMEHITDNVFEYYYEPFKGNVLCAGSNENYPCVDIKNIYPYVTFDIHPTYNILQSEIEFLAQIYKKYFSLNKQSSEYILSGLNKIISDKKTLGVHFRGTDFKQGFINHPAIGNVEQYIKKANEILLNEDYEQIFIATDDLEILKKFQNNFGNKLVYYDDVFRTSGEIGPHGTYNERTLHHYKLGLEVLRDVYTLAHCKKLICGLSQVAFAAQYINIALDKRYDDVIVFDSKINKTNSKMAKNTIKENRKIIKRALQHEFGKGFKK